MRLTLALALALAAVFACLPDLEPFPEEAPALPEAGPPPTRCGDGFIETLDDGGDAGESCDPGPDGGPGCESCQLRCEGVLGTYGHCYFLAGRASYDDASRNCSARGGHLVTFASDDEVKAVSALDAGAAFWVGLRRDDAGQGYRSAAAPNEPGWPSDVATCLGCFAVGADGGRFPAPADAGDAECLLATEVGWSQASCETENATICEREPPGERVFACGGLLCTTLEITAGKKRYVISPSVASPAQARQSCLDQSGELVTFDTPEEREALVREIAHRLDPPITLWIGASGAGLDAAAWAWDDRDAHGPIPWGNLEPSTANAGVAVLHISKTRFDTALAESRPADDEAQNRFVCQRPAP